MDKGSPLAVIKSELKIGKRKIKVKSGFAMHYDRAKKKLRVFDRNNNLANYEGAEDIDIKMPRTGEELAMAFLELFSALSGRKIKVKEAFSNLIFLIE